MTRTPPQTLSLLLAAALSAVALAACGGSGGSHSSTATRASTGTGASTSTGTGTVTAATTRRPPSNQLVSIIEDDGRVLDGNTTVATLQKFKALGATVVRLNIFWQDFAPDANSHTAPAFDASSPAAYPASAWAMYDTIDRYAADYGLTLYLTLTGPGPLWAAGPGAPSKDPSPGNWRPNSAEFKSFVQSVGKRYNGSYTPRGESGPLPRVHFWSIWNEPNYSATLQPQVPGTPSAPMYRDLLEAGWQGLEASGHKPATDTILIGETAPRGSAAENGTPPLPFIRALYCVDAAYKPLTGTAAAALGCPTRAASTSAFVSANPALFDATGWADHPYPDTEPPTEKTGTGFADFAAIPDLEQTLDGAAGAYGKSLQLPIYNTEFGYRTVPPGNANYAVSLADASVWLNQAEYLSWLNPRIRSYNQYLLVDPPLTPSQHFVTGLEFSNGTPKPDVYDAYRVPLWLPTTSGAGSQALQVWGCARPANVAGTPRHVQIQYAPSTGAAFTTVHTVTLSSGSCYFDTSVRFPGGGLVRLAYKGTGATDYSRIQQISK
jgi:hypothetical protein